MNPIEVTKGNCPLVLGFPHTGTDIPGDISSIMNATGRKLADTDWHIDRLYEGILDDVTSVRTRVHRYVIDVNRDPDGRSLYPGQNTTGLCPTTDFDGERIYRDGYEPGKIEIARRTQEFHRPYHENLQVELDRIRELHGFAILLDCHSIRSHIPYLFEGILPDFNIGTNCGITCDRKMEAAIVDVCTNADGYSHVLNARFKGGWTTRHYANPEHGVHAIQLELAQSTYMLETPPWTYDVKKSGRLRVHLKQMLETLSDWRPS